MHQKTRSSGILLYYNGVVLFCRHRHRDARSHRYIMWFHLVMVASSKPFRPHNQMEWPCFGQRLNRCTFFNVIHFLFGFRKRNCYDWYGIWKEVITRWIRQIAVVNKMHIRKAISICDLVISVRLFCGARARFRALHLMRDEMIAAADRCHRLWLARRTFEQANRYGATAILRQLQIWTRFIFVHYILVCF